MDQLLQRALEYFCQFEISRTDFIRSWLARLNLSFHELNLNGGVHFVVHPGKVHKNVRNRYFLAHYDRYKGSPGANDNGASVISLLSLLSEWSEKGEIPCGMVFTDKEELSSEDRITDQGSYALAEWFREQMLNPLFIVLDLCGIGDTPLWSVLNSGEEILDTEGFEEILSGRGGRRTYRLPVIFSDNAGLHRAGFSSFQVSILPRKEAELFYREMGKLSFNTPGRWTVQTLKLMEQSYPATWNTMHTKEDLPDLLEKRAFNLLRRLLSDLSAWQPPC